MGLPVILYDSEIDDADDNYVVQDYYHVNKRIGSRKVSKNRGLVDDFLRNKINHILPVDEEIRCILSSYQVGNVENGNGEGDSINYDFRTNCEEPAVKNEELNSFLTKGYENLFYRENNDSSFWIYYYNNFIVKDILFYDFCGDKTFRIDTDDYMLDISKISCIDCKYRENNLIVAISTVQGEIFFFKINSVANNITFKKINIAHNTKILTVWLGLLSQNLILSFASQYGVIITNINNNLNYSIPIDSNHLDITKATINFPRLTLYSDTKIWYNDNIMQTNSPKLDEIKIMSRENELIKQVSIKPVGLTHLLLVETNQRLLSISNCNNPETTNSTNWYKDTHTILNKSLWNIESNKINYQYSIIKNYIFVCDHHLYDTSITIYEYSKISNEWIFLGFSDIRSKFNIKTINNLDVKLQENKYNITLLTNENEKYQLTI